MGSKDFFHILTSEYERPCPKDMPGTPNSIFTKTNRVAVWASPHETLPSFKFVKHRNSSLKSQHHNLPLKGPTTLKLSTYPSTMFQLCSGKETINSSLRGKKPSPFQLIFFLACSRLMSSGWFIPSFTKGHFSLPAAGHLHLISLLSVFCLGWNKQVHKCTAQLINEWIFQYLIRPSVFWPVDKFS